MNEQDAKDVLEENLTTKKLSLAKFEMHRHVWFKGIQAGATAGAIVAVPYFLLKRNRKSFIKTLGTSSFLLMVNFVFICFFIFCKKKIMLTILQILY